MGAHGCGSGCGTDTMLAPKQAGTRQTPAQRWKRISFKSPKQFSGETASRRQPRSQRAER